RESRTGDQAECEERRGKKTVGRAGHWLGSLDGLRRARPCRVQSKPTEAGRMRCIRVFTVVLLPGLWVRTCYRRRSAALVRMAHSAKGITLDPHFWHTRWAEGRIGFHEGAANALLVAHLGAL